jgi:NAD+ diphosphatase
MIGFSAVADPAQPLRLADGEIEHAFWASREQVRAAATRGDWAARSDDGAVLLPPPVSIARAMLDAWLDERDR